MANWPNHGMIAGPLLMIGLGSIGRAALPLIERHFTFDRARAVVVDPDDRYREQAEEVGFRFQKSALTPQNYRDVLEPLLGEGGVCINLSVDVASIDIMRLCRERGVHYVDTVIEPWAGYYHDPKIPAGSRTNYALRENMHRERRRSPGGITAVSCCGANPGAVSWFVKRALLDVARDSGTLRQMPQSREDWARLMHATGVKGIHIAERDTQWVRSQKQPGQFWNTWSVEGFVSEGLQPAELGWGSHERWKPSNARGHRSGCKSAIYLLQPGADTRVRTWCPSHGAQLGFLVTHNESVSIADYFTLGSGSRPDYRPTCHYAYHPCATAVLSLHELFARGGRVQEVQRILDETEIAGGVDELGVLLYGHARNAYWYGSTLSIEETRALAPHQNATGLQVSSAVVAGVAWALAHPRAGIVEADEMDFERCLEIQRPYLGRLAGFYTDWTPLTERAGLFPEDIDPDDPWQFRNVLVH